MIVKNEEKNLPRVLSSIKELADEIIIVDTGSHDETVQVAKQYGAQVYHFPWCNDFSAARNESLRHATKDYILWLDADDEITREDIPVIRRHIRDHKNTAIFLKLKNIQADGVQESAQLRIFPNHLGIQFEGRIHEQVYYSIVKKGIGFSHCRAAVVHLGYENQTNLIQKIKRNQVMLEEALRENPNDFVTLFFLARTIKGMNRKREALEYLNRAIEIGRHDEITTGTVIYKLAFLEKAFVLCEYGRIDEAITALNDCLSQYPNEELVRFTLGELYFKGADYEKAHNTLLPLKDATFENELLPMDLQAVKNNLHMYLGVSALYCGDFQRAAMSLKKIVDVRKQDISIYHYLILAMEKSNDIDGAIKACNKALGLFVGDSALLKRLFLLHVKKESFGEALEVFERLNGYSSDVDVVTAMFYMKCRQMQIDGIIQYYSMLQKTLNIFPEPFPEGFTYVKNCLENQGETKAFAMFDSAISFLLRQTT